MLQRERGKRKSGGSHRMWPNIGGRVSSLLRLAAMNKLFSLAARAAFNRLLDRHIFCHGAVYFQAHVPSHSAKPRIRPGAPWCFNVWGGGALHLAFERRKLQDVSASTWADEFLFIYPMGGLDLCSPGSAYATEEQHAQKGLQFLSEAIATPL